jgi:hypothetical protein
LQDIHKDLEAKIAKFHDTEDAILYASCFDANAGFFETLLTADDAVISDELNHASIIDGIRLCKAKRFRYKHTDMAGETTYPHDMVLNQTICHHDIIQGDAKYHHDIMTLEACYTKEQ